MKIDIQDLSGLALSYALGKVLGYKLEIFDDRDRGGALQLFKKVVGGSVDFRPAGSIQYLGRELEDHGIDLNFLFDGGCAISASGWSCELEDGTELVADTLHELAVMKWIYDITGSRTVKVKRKVLEKLGCIPEEVEPLVYIREVDSTTTDLYDHPEDADAEVKAPEPLFTLVTGAPAYIDKERRDDLNKKFGPYWTTFDQIRGLPYSQLEKVCQAYNGQLYVLYEGKGKVYGVPPHHWVVFEDLEEELK